MSFVTRIKDEARKASEVRTTDPERVKAFMEGAYFAVSYLCRVMQVSPMEDSAGVEGFLDKLRLKDVREAVSYLLQGVKEKA